MAAGERADIRTGPTAVGLGKGPGCKRWWLAILPEWAFSQNDDCIILFSHFLFCNFVFLATP